MYTDDEVAELINRQTIPVKIHVKEQPQVFERFGAQWTPTIIILDTNGKEQHRIEGFLPADDFAMQVRLGLAHAARSAGDFAAAEKLYRELSDIDGNDDVAAESLYWAGVSKYKGSNDAAALGETAAAFKKRFTNSSWAKKSSVWG